VAEDLTSESFMALAQKINAGADIEDSVKYLYGIARNNWNAYLRDKYKIKIVYTDAIEDLAKSVEQEADEWENSTLESRASKFINKLPKKQKEVVHRRLIIKQTNKEIAESMGVDYNYVKVTLRRGLRNLEKLIELNSREKKS
jgi:RNA polymerase sigma factor (sigma-70 family)